MKLGREEIVPGNDRGEGRGVFGRGDRVFIDRQRIAVHEVEPAAAAQVRKDGMFSPDLDRAPAHVGDRAMDIAFEFPDRAGDYAQAVDIIFFGSLGQQLHAQADAEHRLFECANNVDQPPIAQSLHGVGGRADTGQDHPVGPLDLGSVGRQGSGTSQPLAGIEQGRDIRATTVDYGDRRRHLAQRPLGRGHVGACSPDRLSQSAADALETGFHHVMRVVAIDIDM